MKKCLSVWMSLVAAGALAAESNVPLPGVIAATGSVANPLPVTGVATATTATASVSALPAAPAPDPQVGKVLMGMAATLQAAKSFKCTVALQVNTEMEGMKQEISAVYDLAAEKPNRLALRYVRGMAGNTVVCNGEKMYIYALSLNRYEERVAPKRIEELAEGVGPMAGNMLFVDNLLVNDIYAGIMEGVSSATYVGKERVEGTECEHVRFVQEQFDWDLWVSTGPAPVVVQVVSDMAKSFSGLAGDAAPPKGMKMQVINRFSGWRMDATLPADTFVFTPPPGARKAESLFEGTDEEPAEVPVPAVMKEIDNPKAGGKIESRE